MISSAVFPIVSTVFRDCNAVFAATAICRFAEPVPEAGVTVTKFDGFCTVQAQLLDDAVSVIPTLAPVAAALYSVALSVKLQVFPNCANSVTLKGCCWKPVRLSVALTSMLLAAADPFGAALTPIDVPPTPLLAPVNERNDPCGSESEYVHGDDGS